MRALYFTWCFLDLCLLGAGVIALVYGIIAGKHEDILTTMAITRYDEQVGLLTGACLVATFVLSLFAIKRPIHRNKLLIVLNWALLIDACIATAVGTSIWFTSLRTRTHFAKVWSRTSTGDQIELQDKFSCCGYWNGTSAGLFAASGGFCIDSTFASNQTGCIGDVVANTTFQIENVFTSIYGFVAVLIALFLATVCMINERKIQVRFAKIDLKQGGRGGFV